MILTKQNTPSATATALSAVRTTGDGDAPSTRATAGGEYSVVRRSYAADDSTRDSAVAWGGADLSANGWVTTDEIEEDSAAVISRPAKPKNPASSSKPKRKKFSKSDDLMLLRQVNTDHPYKSVRGGVMDAWSAVANKLKGLEDFTKTEITGKSAQARFNVLIERHRAFDRSSAAASGVSEVYDETIQLLDDLLLEVDEHTRSEELRSEEQKQKLTAEERTGKFIRDEAVARLKKRKERSGDDQNETTPRKVTVFDIMREDNEKERELRAEQWKQEQEMMQQHKLSELQDRKEEREFRLRIAQLENERFKTLLKLAKVKSRGNNSNSASDCDDLDVEQL